MNMMVARATTTMVAPTAVLLVTGTGPLHEGSRMPTLACKLWLNFPDWLP